MSTVLPKTFRALVVDQRDGAYTAEIRELPAEALPDGDVTIAVAYSSLNYKDGLCVTGQGRVARSFPMVPGIDLAGTVVESRSPHYTPGKAVVLTGWGIGERHWGGFATLARVRSEWLVPLPEGLTLRQAMGIGTAGFTAMLAVMELEEAGVRPGQREVLVTGASGGVGSIAVAVLSRLGYNVTASTGRPEHHDYLRHLGARQILAREELTRPGRPMESERWAGAVDTVGGDTLAGVIRSAAYYGAIAACGNAGGATLTTTVFPFILRGVRLIGVESVLCPQDRRRTAWARLTRDLPRDLLEGMIRTATLEEVPDLSREIVAGRVRGRVVIELGTR
ncbi:MAG TPA: MDR family oxidoreductase [Roseiflexaceae bacterium]|nr:MDR family oxidoreductase [Roseiflexaceae bacterium]